MYVFVYMAHVSNAHGGKKRVSDSLELELQMVVNYPVWVLGSLPVQQMLRTTDSLSNPFSFFFSFRSFLFAMIQSLNDWNGQIQIYMCIFNYI